MKKLFLILLLLTIVVFDAEAKRNGNFYSTKSSRTNMRTGPGHDYPIKFIYLKMHVPLIFIEEFEGWIKVKDINDDEGWINRNVLTSKRYVVTTKLTAGYAKSSEESDIRVTLDPTVILELKKCTVDWCFVKLMSHKIWVKKSAIWGVKPEEVGDL